VLESDVAGIPNNLSAFSQKRQLKIPQRSELFTLPDLPGPQQRDRRLFLRSIQELEPSGCPPASPELDRSVASASHPTSTLGWVHTFWSSG
jgi:hypothetical protein